MEAQSFSLSVKGKRAGLRQRPKGSAYSQDNSCDTKDTGRNTSKSEPFQHFLVPLPWLQPHPPHKMHINIGEELIKQGYLDKIIFVPTGIKYKYKSFHRYPDSRSRSQCRLQSL